MSRFDELLSAIQAGVAVDSPPEIREKARRLSERGPVTVNIHEWAMRLAQDVPNGETKCSD